MTLKNASPAVLLLGLPLLLMAPACQAVLGQPLAAAPAASAASASSSFGSSASAINRATAVVATLSASPSALYSTRSSSQANGVTVTEYADTSSVVFAVRWQGPMMPPLDVLLGSYFQDFQQRADASRSQRSLGSPLRIDSATLVVRSMGRMGNFHGYAYDPKRVPAGLQIDHVLH